MNLESQNTATPVATANQDALSTYTFTRNVRPMLMPKASAEPVTRVTLISSQGGAADTIATTGLTISQDNILDSGDASPWPGDRYEQDVLTVVNPGSDVTAIVTEVPVPASMLLVVAGFGLVGFSRSRYASVR